MTCNVMILAAGRGTRLRELTANTPKPLVSVGNVPPLKRTMALLAKNDFKHVVINVHYLGEQIIHSVTHESFGLNVAFSEEETLLDTGGGIKNALPQLGKEPFLSINGDVVWGEEDDPILKTLPKHFDAAKMDACLLVVPCKNAPTYKGSGDFFLEEDGTLRPRGSEETSAPYVYTGIMMLNPAIFTDLPNGAFPMIQGFRQAAMKGRLYGVAYAGDWVDMGTPEGLHAAEDLVNVS